MEMLLDNKSDLVEHNEQLGNSKIEFDKITETAQDIDQNLNNGIKSCEVTVVSEHNMDINVKSIENSFSDSVVVDKDCEEDIDSNYTLIIENVQERNDKHERCKDKESIGNEIIEFLEKEDNNIERFENIDVQDASQSSRSEQAVKEDYWIMSNKGDEQDSHLYVEKSQIECWNSASGAPEAVQLSPSNDRASQIFEYPVSVRLKISAGNEFSCSGNENTSGSNSDQQENDLLEKLDEQSSSINPLEEHKKLSVSEKEVKAVGDPEGWEIPCFSQLEQSFPMALEASHGDVGKEKTVQNANRNMCHSSTIKCSVCGKVCLGQARMVSHMRVHSGEQPFDCKICGFNFKYKEDLKRHQKMHKFSKQTNVCEETEFSASVKEYVNSHCRFLKRDERKLISSVDKVLSTTQKEQSIVDIFACSVVLDKINLQDQNTEVYLKHHTKEELTTNITPVQIPFSQVSPINSKTKEDKDGSPDKVEKNDPWVEGVLKCPLCNKSYSHKQSLDKHKRHVHPNLWHQETVLSMRSKRKIFMCKYKCDKCAFRFFSPAGLIRHQKKFCSIKLTDCSEENKTSSSQSNQKIIGKEAQVLDYEYSRLRQLNMFSSSDMGCGSGNEKTNICRFCGRMFSRRINLHQHEQMHIRKKLLNAVESEVEQESFSQNAPVNSDELLNASKQQKCKFCGRMFSRRINLHQHEQMHIRERLNTTKLQAENQSFSLESRNHQSPVNSDKISDNSKTHKCKFCGRMFSRRLNLIQHEQVHKRRKQVEKVMDEGYPMESDDKKRSKGPFKKIFKISSVQMNHKCRFCSRKFFRRCNLCQHEPVCYKRQIIRKQNLENSNRNKTPNSSLKKVSVSFVKNPLRLISNNKFNSCQYCRKIFSTKSNLNRHVKLHKQKKKFFKQKNNNSIRTDDSHDAKRKSPKSIRNRVRIISTDNRHPCQYCGKWFLQELDLSEHLKLHSQKSIQLKHGNTVYSSSSVKNNLRMDTSGSGQNVNTSESDQNIKRENINKTPHICRFCGKLFARRTNLCQHEPVCHRRQIIRKQNLENSNRIKTHNSSSKKVSVGFENSFRVISNDKFNSCQYCSKIFSTKSNLNRHVKLHKQKKKFFKQINNSSIRTDTSPYAKRKSPKSIRNQVRNISTDNLHPCQHCGKWFPQKLDLSQHLKLHSQKNTLLEQGNTVNSSSSVKSNLHMNTSGSGQNVNASESDQKITRENINKTPHICRFCGRLFARRINLCQHEPVCHRRQIIRKQKPENNNRIKTHDSSSKKVSVSFVKNSHRVISNNKFNSCQYCKKIFSTKSNLNRHVKLHKQKKKIFLQKNNSNNRTNDGHYYAKRKSPNSIKKQVINISTDNRHPCQYCGKWFPQKLDLSEHLKLHCQKNAQLEQGNTVNSSSSVKSNLHMDTSGSGQNIHTSESDQNIKREHLNKTPHICRFCGRLFARRINLCQHEPVCHRRQIIRKQKPENNIRIKTHNSISKKVSVSSVENPHGVISNNKFNICQYCKKCFSNKSNLNRHVKLHEQKKKFLQQKTDNSRRSYDNPYAKRKSHDPITNRVNIVATHNRHSCQKCGKWFRQKLDLSQHLKLHSQESTQLEHGNNFSSVSTVTTDLYTNTSESAQNIKKENISTSLHICRFCGRFFARRLNLCQHERVCHRRQIIGKQNPENSNRNKSHNSSLKKVSVGFVENPHRVISNNNFNSCPYCRKIFSTKSNLNRHVKLHEQEKKYFKQKNNSSNRTDDSLYAKRKSSKSIRNQVRIISTDNLHPCQHCGKWFLQKLDLSQHLKSHSQESIQLEHGNAINSSSSVTTDLHIDTSESDQEVKKENLSKTPHICRFCGRLFARRTNLCQHEQWHKQKDGKVFKEDNKKAIHSCRICGRLFERRVNLCQHERCHSQKNVHFYRREMFESKPFQAKRNNRCLVCSKICTNKSDLLLHYESRHTEDLRCQICNTLVGTYVHLRKHMRTHVKFSMVDTKELSHDQRAKYTNAAHFPKNAKVGKRSQVTEESHKVPKSKKYKCTLCAMSFNTHSLLFLHKKKHMSAHACFVCGKIFTRKFDLDRHLRIHTGDQPHECDICLKGFRCRLNLSDHMGTHVLKEANEFQCDGCKAMFFDQQSILNHLESAHTSHHKVSHLGTQIIHNNNELQGNEHGLGRENIESDSVINYSQSKKPIFSCGICGEIYEEASHLYLHMGNHVNESVENENGEETGITVKAESFSTNRQMDNQHSCKLENRSSHNDMQNSQGKVCRSDFGDTIKNETSFVSVVSILDGEVNTFDHATESLSDEYIDDGIDDTVDDGIDGIVDHSESVYEFPDVNQDNEIDERTISVDRNAANIGDITKILECTELNKKFKCGLCMHMFSSKHGLSQHKRWHANTDVRISQMKKDYCSVCKIYFSSKSSFTLHLSWHKSGLAKKVVISDKISIPLKPYRCEKCGKTFTRKDSLGKHKCMIHYSQNKSRSKVVMSKSIMKSVVPNGFICEVCGCSYAQRACLVQHLLHKHNLAEKNFEAVCDEKENPFKCQHLLNNAGLTSRNPKYQKGNQNPKCLKGNQKAYKCIFCRKQYIKRHAYLLHTSRAHPNYYQNLLGNMTEESSNKKKCKYCKNWYNSNDNTGHKDKFNCKSCELIFPCKGCFIQHLDLPESSELEGWFWCCVCQIKFSNRNELKKHIPLHASDLGRYNCRICGQIFKYKQHLFRHEKVHGTSLQYSLKNSYACEESPYDAMHLHQKTDLCTDHKTSRKHKRQFRVNAESYNCTNMTNVVEVNMVSPAGVGSDIFSSPLPRQDDEIAQDIAYHPDETISNQGKEVTSNLGSLEAFPVSIKQELIDLCDNPFCGSTCTSPVEELENNGIVHNSDFDKSIQDTPFLNRVGSEAARFDLSPVVQPNERVEQDDIQSNFEDSEQDEVDIDNIHDSNRSPIDKSDMLYFVRSTMETGQNDSLALLKEVLENPYSEAQSGHKSPQCLFKAAHFKDMKDFDERQGSTELIPGMESSNKNDNFHSRRPSDNSDDKANDTSKEDLFSASKITPTNLKQTEDMLRKDTSANSHHQEHQIVKDSESTTPGINQESKEHWVRCIICCKTVYSEELVRHLQSHADLKLYECEHCNECFLSAMSYSEHMEKNYGEIVCCACGEAFTEKKDLIMHIRKHNFDVVLNCSICGAVFTSHDTFIKHLEFHVLSEAKSADTQNDTDDSGSRDIEIISSEDREEEEEILRALMEDQEDAEKTMSSVITSASTAWKQMSMTLLSDAVSSEFDEAADIKPDINKLNDTMWMQNAYKNMETIMGCNQTILDRMVQNSLCQGRAEPINTVSGTPLNRYGMWKKLAGKIIGSEHAHLYDRCQKEQCQADTSTSFDMFPIRTEPREPEKVPVIKTEFFEQDTQLLIEDSERPGRAGLMQPGLKPCFVKLEKIDCKILTCSLCLRLFVNENALKHHYLLHLIPGYKFS
ncbi:hypothetical protein CHS0354_013317 [Potamilus streckersoni]|uniref:C2H2-type domain-containing protein n=1 Tax=Potamilus streckersoni TaxID=2493646 RepID=A0AAE0VZB0_9BIVA|nr:hypothetical protein CHS0354_013317 [Potamilus streckersoni]